MQILFKKPEEEDAEDVTSVSADGGGVRPLKGLYRKTCCRAVRPRRCLDCLVPAQKKPGLGSLCVGGLEALGSLGAFGTGEKF